MMALAALLLSVALADIPLATFDGATAFEFQGLRDRSKSGWSNFHLDSQQHVGIFAGEVVDDGLQQSGSIKAVASGTFPDASAGSSSGAAVVLLVRSRTPEQTFGLSFAATSGGYACAHGGTLPLSRGCYRARFQVPASTDFVEVTIPLRDFSDLWTATCAQESSVCPTAQSLAQIKRLEISAERPGQVHLEVKSIAVRPAFDSTMGSAPPAEYNGCSHPVQPQLRFNISSRKEPTVPVPVDPSETLADAVCCDKRTKVYAEPQFLYEAPDIALFKHLEPGVTTFYDSTCGVPLFKAPVNRSLADFEADTKEHGWPSFRKEEVFSQHVTVDKDGFVYSSCGTHLGSYLPDAQGPRYCMDLSCIAGKPEIVV